MPTWTNAIKRFASILASGKGVFMALHNATSGIDVKNKLLVLTNQSTLFEKM